MTVTQKQCLLAYMDCLPAAVIDGIWGPQSAQATAEMQRKLGIPDDGVWGEQTDAAVREYVYSGQDITPEETKETGTFWDHIRYWSREEFRCRCGGKYCNGFPAEPSHTLVSLLDDTREYFGRPGYRSSGLRCKTWNTMQNGVATSRHMSGKAMDFRIDGKSSAEVLAYLNQHPSTRYAYAIDNTWVHVDVA